MATLYLSPLTMIVQYFTNVGVIAAGATVTTYLAGSTSTLQTTYTDSTGATANPNPLTLNSAARPAGQSGAQTAFWQPSGVAITAVFTDTLGETWSIPNIPGINDPTASGSLQSLLSSPSSSNAAGTGPVAGADLVANAVKSYDVFADVRAANAPILASGQTLTIEVQGAAAINDGLGGNFYWNATSSATDNGASVLKPNSISGAGRWLRLGTPPFGALQTIASAATTDLGTLSSNLVSITGTTAITSFGTSASLSRALYVLNFLGGGVLLTYNAATLLLPGAENILTAAGDTAIALYLGAGAWQVLGYFRNLGGPAESVAVTKTADQQIISSTVLTNDNTLTLLLVAGISYLIQLRLMLLGTTSTGQGYKVALIFGGTFTGVSSGIGVASANLTPAAVILGMGGTLTEAAISDTTADVVNMDFPIEVATSGQLTVQFAQNSSNANATTMKAGSTMIVTRVS